MRLLAGWICFFTVGTVCVLAMSPKPPGGPVKKDKDVISILLTGNELGELKPCGCSGGQLGGFERRATIFKGFSESKRLIVDTGSFVKSSGEQDLIKLNIIIQAFSLLDYDVVRMTKVDIERVRSTGLLDSLDGVFNVISSDRGEFFQPAAKYTKSLSLDNRSIDVTVADIDTTEGAIAKVIFESFGDTWSEEKVNIAILDRCDEDILDQIGKTEMVDCVICPSESDEAAVIGDPDKRPLAVTVGRYGKYVGNLQIEPSKTRGHKPRITFSAIPVTEDVPEDRSLAELYKLYQQLVREDGLLESHPRFVLPGGLKYAGSKSCETCHSYEYEKWSTKAHARAYSTLEEVGSQYDPECVVCHVVGMDYESGFVSEETTGQLKNVGCENCHGPGSEHIISLGVQKTSEPKSQCVACHTPDNSANYTENEQAYFEKIIHWVEPNSPSTVQN